MIFYCKGIKKNNYNWLTYEEFKNIEKKIILEENGQLDINNVSEIINAINKIEIKEDNVSNNIIDIGHESKIENLNIENELKVNDEFSEDDLIDSEDNIEENEEEENNQQTDNEYKIPNLFERLLMDDKNIKYTELIKDIKKKIFFKLA